MRRFALLGHPVRHSLSPLMHAASFRALGFAGSYQTIEVVPAELANALRECAARGYQGLNLTVPHKSAALELMDQLDASARLYSAVNTVRIDAHGLTGYNTDAVGFTEDLTQEYRQELRGRCVMIVGCGGAGRAIAIACAQQGVAELYLANRTLVRAERVAREIEALAVEAAVAHTTKVVVVPSTPDAWIAQARQAQVIVQCTTAGLRDVDQAVLPPTAFHVGQFLYDIVYNRRVTPTMAAALKAGAKAVNGLGMLVCQGAAAFTIWTGLKADSTAMRTALEQHIFG